MTPDQAQAEMKQAWDDDELVGQLKTKIETLEGSIENKEVPMLAKAGTEGKIRQLKAKIGAIKGRSINPSAALNIMRANTAPKATA